MKNYNLKWLIHDKISFSDSFLRACCEQLQVHAQQVLDIDIRKFLVVTEDATPRQRTDQETRIAYLEGNIITPMPEMLPITIAWFSEANPKVFVDPSQPLLPETQVKILWTTLPDYEEFDYYRKPPPPLIEIPPNLSFEVACYF